MFLYQSGDVPLGAWITSTDPSIADSAKLQPGTMWIDTTSIPYPLKKWNSTDDGWDLVGYFTLDALKTVTSQFDKTNTTLADVTGLSVTVTAGKKYSFTALLYTTSDVGGGVKVAIGGSATA